MEQHINLSRMPLQGHVPWLGYLGHSAEARECDAADIEM